MYMLCYVVMRFIFNCSTTQYVVAVFWDHSICHLQYIEKLNSFASFIYPIYRSIVCLVVIRSSIFTRTHVVSFVNKIPRIFDREIFFEDRLHKFCLKFVISNLTSIYLTLQLQKPHHVQFTYSNPTRSRFGCAR